MHYIYIKKNRFFSINLIHITINIFGTSAHLRDHVILVVIQIIRQFINELFSIRQKLHEFRSIVPKHNIFQICHERSTELEIITSFYELFFTSFKFRCVQIEINEFLESFKSVSDKETTCESVHRVIPQFKPDSDDSVVVQDFVAVHLVHIECSIQFKCRKT